MRKPGTPILLTTLLLAGVLSAQWVEDSIDVGGRWVGGMVYNSRADVVYGNCQYTDGIFFAIDGSTNQLAASWRIPWPREAAYDSIDNKCYVAFRDGGEDSVMVVDGQTHTRMKAIPLDGANIPVWDPVSNRLYVSCLERNRVSVIDCTTDSVIAHIPTPAGPLKMHLNTRHRKLYVLCHDAESLAIVDLNTNQVRRKIGLPNVPEAGCYSKVADKYYCGAGRTLTVVCGQGDTVLTELTLPVDVVRCLEVIGATQLVMAGAWHSDSMNSYSVYAISTRHDTVVSQLPVGREPEELFWSPESRRVYVCNNLSHSVSVLADDGSRVIRTLKVGGGPFTFAHTPVQNRVFVGHLGDNRVFVIRDTTAGVAESQPVAVERPPFPTVMRAADLTRIDGRILDAMGRAIPRGTSASGAGYASHLSTGVYFIQRKGSGGQGVAGPSIRRVLVVP